MKEEGVATVEIVKPEVPKFEFGNLAEAEQYLDWKESVPPEVRRVVEGNQMGNQVDPSQTELPLSGQFLNGLSEALREKKFVIQTGMDSRVGNLLAPLEKVGTKGGYLNVFETLDNPSVSWNLKKTIYETQIKPALEWLANRDLEDLAEQAAKRAEKSTDQPQKASPEEDPSSRENTSEDQVPPQSEDVRSSMEGGMEKREGAPKALFRISPFYGGYYKQLAFNSFDTSNLQWRKQDNIFREAETEPIDLLKSRILSGKIAGGTPLSLPLPYDWALDSESLHTDAPEGSASITRNQDGLWYLNIDADGVFDYQIKGGPRKTVERGERFLESETEGELPAELSNKIEELKKSHLPKMRQFRELAKFIRNGLTYSNSNEAWKQYAERPDEFFKRIWEGREADCFVANTLAVRALSEIDRNVNFVGGFMVKEKNKDGEAILHSGNGHAWLEVWDEMSGQSVRLDATPVGDPNVDAEEQEKDLEGETGEGDYGESDDELASTEEVKKKIQKMKADQNGKERRAVSHADMEWARFAVLAECSPGQAREFLDALERVRLIKDQQGNPISDRLKDEWKKIVTERKVEYA